MVGQEMKRMGRNLELTGMPSRLSKTLSETKEWKEDGDENGDSGLDQADLVIEYLKLCEQYPVPWRMIRSHVHKMLGDWFKVHPEVREELNKQNILTFEWLHDMVMRLKELGGRVPLYRKDSAQQTEANELAASNA
nr:unnamed protein product [Digitaria exilis]